MVSLGKGDGRGVNKGDGKGEGGARQQIVLTHGHNAGNTKCCKAKVIQLLEP